MKKMETIKKDLNIFSLLNECEKKLQLLALTHLHLRY